MKGIAEAFKLLAQVAAKNARSQLKTDQKSHSPMPRECLDLADRLLDNVRFQQDGDNIQINTSVELDSPRLTTIVSAIDAAANTQRAVMTPSAKLGMRALVEDFFHHNFRDVTSHETIEWGDVIKTADGNFSIRYKYRARIWDKETRIINQVFTFDKDGKFVSVKDKPASGKPTRWAMPPGARAASPDDIAALLRKAEAATKAVRVHIAAKMRTPPQDNFSAIGADYEFVPIDVWKQFGDKAKWRVEKPQRVAVMDGESTVMLMRQQTVVKVPHAAESAFDTNWLLGLASPGGIFREFRNALAKEWDVKLAEVSVDGKELVMVFVETKSGLSDDNHMKNKFFMTADLRCVYRLDAKTMRLEGCDAYLHQPDGDVKVFAIEQIEYDKPVDPKVFTLDIPKTAVEYKEPQRLADNEKYEKMTPLESVRAFFDACAKEDWNEAGKFYQPLTDDVKKYLRGLKIVSLGEPFQAKPYPGWIIPYEIKFKDGNTKSWKLSVRNDNPAKRYVVDGGL